MCIRWNVTRNVTKCVRTVRCYLYRHPSRSRHSPMSGTRILYKKKLHDWWMCKTVKKFENSGRLGQQLKQYSLQFPGINWTRIVGCLRLPFLPPLLVLPFFCLPLSPQLRITQCWEFHHVGFCDHDEEEDEVGVEKYVCQFWLSHSKFRWIVDRIQCVVLSCPQMHRNMRDTFALFLLQAHQRTCCCFVIFSFPRWSCLEIWIVTSHEDHVSKTISLAVRHYMRDVNSGEVVHLT